jgi:hypothetical protein
VIVYCAGLDGTEFNPNLHNSTTALTSPSSDGEPKAATVVDVAPDDGHEDAGNMLSCI